MSGITTQPGATFTADALGLAPGLLGTITFGVRTAETADTESTFIVAATTNAIVEFPQGDGTSNYRATRTMPADATVGGAYETAWPDDLVADQEPIVVTGSGTVTGPFYVDPATVRRALDPDSDGTAEGSSNSTAATLDDGELGIAIEGAQSEVDAKTPGAPFDLSAVPQLVIDLTRDVAAYLATLTYFKGNPLDRDDPVRLRYERAKGLLADLGAGKANVGGETGTDTAEAAVVNPYEGDLWVMDDLGLGPDRRSAGWPFGRMP
jgi:hypothetical protein